MDSSNLIAILSAYLGGVLSSLTPCVYPLIPITLSIVGAGRTQTRLQSLSRASLYVGGMSITYATLGIISARAGSLFGAAFQRPVFVVPFGLMLAILALSELDVIPVSLFSRLQRGANRLGGGSSWLSIMVMGGVSGLVAAPCIGPILAGILALAASSENARWGGTLLFTYSLGLGTPFLILGTFSGLLSRLPRSGSWLNGIKSLLGIALFVVSLRFVYPWLPPMSIPSRAAFVLLPLFVGLLAFSYQRALPMVRAIAALGCAVIVAPQTLSAGIPKGTALPAQVSGSSAPVWFHSLEEAKEQSLNTGKPILVDFFAEWCSACKQLDAITFEDEAIKQELVNHWVATRIDLTNPSPGGDELQKAFAIQGLPTILFLSASEGTPNETRIVEFVEPARLLDTLRRLRGR